MGHISGAVDSPGLFGDLSLLRVFIAGGSAGVDQGAKAAFAVDAGIVGVACVRVCWEVDSGEPVGRVVAVGCGDPLGVGLGFQVSGRVVAVSGCAGVGRDGLVDPAHVVVAVAGGVGVGICYRYLVVVAVVAETGADAPRLDGCDEPAQRVVLVAGVVQPGVDTAGSVVARVVAELGEGVVGVDDLGQPVEGVILVAKRLLQGAGGVLYLFLEFVAFAVVMIGDAVAGVVRYLGLVAVGVVGIVDAVAFGQDDAFYLAGCCTATTTAATAAVAVLGGLGVAGGFYGEYPSGGVVGVGGDSTVGVGDGLGVAQAVKVGVSGRAAQRWGDADQVAGGVVAVGGYVAHVGPGAVDGFQFTVSVVGVGACVAKGGAVAQQAGCGGLDEVAGCVVRVGGYFVGGRIDDAFFGLGQDFIVGRVVGPGGGFFQYGALGFGLAELVVARVVGVGGGCSKDEAGGGDGADVFPFLFAGNVRVAVAGVDGLVAEGVGVF